MRCPKCLNETRVIATRTRLDNVIRRTRLCEICKHRFASNEYADSDYRQVTRDEILEVIHNLEKALTTLAGPRNE